MLLVKNVLFYNSRKQRHRSGEIVPISRVSSFELKPHLRSLSFVWSFFGLLHRRRHGCGHRRRFGVAARSWFIGVWLLLIRKISWIIFRGLLLTHIVPSKKDFLTLNASTCRLVIVFCLIDNVGERIEIVLSRKAVEGALACTWLGLRLGHAGAGFVELFLLLKHKSALFERDCSVAFNLLGV